jgi:hypothetical protein
VSGYLQYKDLTTGDWGSLQQTEWDGWQHLMPLVPSREYGSAMHLDTDTDPWTLKAARECARPFNSNAAVGGARLANAKDKTWRSPRAIALHAVPATTPTTMATTGE